MHRQRGRDFGPRKREDLGQDETGKSKQAPGRTVRGDTARYDAEIEVSVEMMERFLCPDS